jgi:hypothetical protein
LKAIAKELRREAWKRPKDKAERDKLRAERIKEAREAIR